VGSCHSGDTWKSALFPDSSRDTWHKLSCGYIARLETIAGVLVKLAWFWEMCLYKYRFQNTCLHPGHRMAIFELGSGGFDSFHPIDFHLLSFAVIKIIVKDFALSHVHYPTHSVGRLIYFPSFCNLKNPTIFWFEQLWKGGLKNSRQSVMCGHLARVFFFWTDVSWIPSPLWALLAFFLHVPLLGKRIFLFSIFLFMFLFWSNSRSTQPRTECVDRGNPSYLVLEKKGGGVRCTIDRVALRIVDYVDSSMWYVPLWMLESSALSFKK